jgi:hypothetical protein
MLTDSTKVLMDAMAHAETPPRTIATAKLQRARGRLRRALEKQERIESWTQPSSQHSLPQQSQLSADS